MADIENNAAAAQAEGTTTTKKQNVLLSFVGFTDPWSTRPFTESDKEELLKNIDINLVKLYPGTSSWEESCQKGGAILGLCGGLKPEHRPDILYMFPSCKEKNPLRKNNSQWRAEWIEKILKEWPFKIDCHILPLDITDPTNFEQISKEWAHNIDIALDELKVRDNPDKYQFHLNCTSATQQMTAVAYVFASTGQIPGIIRWHCKDPQFVKEGDKRIVEVNATFLEENEYRKRLEAGVKHLSFVSVQDSCKALSEKASSPRQRLIAEHLGNIFEAYVSMDALRYHDAYMSMCKEKDSSAFWDLLDDKRRRLLNDQVDMLRILQNGSIQESAENLTDLYFNMKRCLTRGAYADVLARFWRMGEGCVYHRLRTYHHVNDIEEKRIHFAEGREMLVSNKSDDPLCETLRSIFEKSNFSTLIDRRNKTIVAHGMRSVSEDNAKACIPIAERLLLTLVPAVSNTQIGKSPNTRPLIKKYSNTEALIKNYPFREENIMTWVEIF